MTTIPLSDKYVAEERAKLSDAVNVGDYVKVHLTGESPWVEVIEVAGHLIKGRITNKLVAQYSDEEQAAMLGSMWHGERLPVLHSFKQNDVLWFERGGEFNNYQPVNMQ